MPSWQRKHAINMGAPTHTATSHAAGKSSRPWRRPPHGRPPPAAPPPSTPRTAGTPARRPVTCTTRKHSSCWTIRIQTPIRYRSIDRTSCPVLCCCAGQVAASKGAMRDEPPACLVPAHHVVVFILCACAVCRLPTVVCSTSYLRAFRLRQVAGSNAVRGTRVVGLMAEVRFPLSGPS